MEGGITMDIDLTNVTEVKVVRTDGHCNNLIKDGWKLINVCSYSDPFEKESGTEFTLARFQ